MNPVITAVIIAAASFLLGGIPFGVIIGKSMKGVDIRTTGSGNIGTSNAFRALGPVGGSLVFLCDTLKGALPVIAAGWLISDPSVLSVARIAAGACAILGHNFSPFLNFKGGKGVATSFGVFLALNWLISIICFAFWGLIVLVLRISSVASMSAALCLPVLAFAFNQDMPFKVFAVMAFLLVIYMHRSNIKRLINGEELRMSTKEKKNVSGGSSDGTSAEASSDSDSEK